MIMLFYQIKLQIILISNKFFLLLLILFKKYYNIKILLHILEL